MRSVFRKPGLAVCAVGAFLLASCTSGPVSLDLAPVALPSAKPAGVSGVQIQLESFTDRRMPSENVGVVAWRVFSGGDVKPWIEQALMELRSSRYRITREPDREGRQPRLKVELMKAYVDSLHTSKIAVVVLQVELVSESSGACFKRVYRGQSTLVNWASTSSEVSDGMREALVKCLEPLSLDLELSTRL